MKIRSLEVECDSVGGSMNYINTVFENIYNSIRDKATKTVCTTAASVLLSACVSGDYFRPSREVSYPQEGVEMTVFKPSKYHQQVSHSARISRFFGRFDEEERKTGFEQWLEQHPGWEFLIDRLTEVGLYMIIDKQSDDREKKRKNNPEPYNPRGPDDDSPGPYYGGGL